MTPPMDYKKIAHEFPQVPEWTKVMKWSPEDGCYVGYIEGPLGPCCHGDDPETVRKELAEIEREWRAFTWYARGTSCECSSQRFSGFKRTAQLK